MVDITKGNIWKQLLLFFFPIMLGTFFQQIYNTADTIVVGRFVGKVALAAVGGSTTQLVNLSVGFIVGLTSGASIVFAQFYGAADEKNLYKVLHTSFSFSIAFSFILSFLGIYFLDDILMLMNTPIDIIPDTVTYLRIYFLGIIFAVFYNMGASILRASGDSKRPLYILILSCVLNIILDLILVIQFDLGILGVAYGTIFSQALSGFIVIILLCKGDKLYKLKLSSIHLHISSLKSILLVGIPIAMESMMYNISNIIIQSFVNNLGTDTVAAWGTFSKIDGIYWLINGAFGISITTFIAQNYGAGKYKRMNQSVKIGFILSFLTGAIINIFIYVFREKIFLLFTHDMTVVKIGVDMMTYMLPSYLIFVIIEVLTSSFRGIGKVVIPTILVGFGVCALRLIWMFTYVRYNYNIYSIMISYPISWIITSILFIIYYFLAFPRKLDETKIKNLN